MDPKAPSTSNNTADGLYKLEANSPKDMDSTDASLGASARATKVEPHECSLQDTASSPTVPSELPERGSEASELLPASTKRPISEQDEAPLSKKIKSGEDMPSEPSSSALDMSNIDELKANWQGYCEIESDPAYFSVILREIGIQGVDVQELALLDPAHLMTLPTIHGLVLLFRHREFDQDKQESICPDHVWFANQMPGQNSCATLAMIHTLLNVEDPNIDIGEHMQQFKNFTEDMTPPQRGHTFASWNYVKEIHNSFAKKMDMLENDKYLASKSAKSEKHKAAGLKKTAPLKTAPKPRSKPARRDSQDSNSSDASVEEFEANAHHYIAFVPVNGDVWKLDGMDKQPTLLGKYDESRGEMWFDNVSDRINALIGAGDHDYGIYAITQSPLVPLRNKLIEADNTIKHVQTRLTSTSGDWKQFLDEDDREPPSPSFMESFGEAQRAANPIPESIKAAIDKEDMPALLDRYRSLVATMRNLIMRYMEKEQEVTDQHKRADDRRWDYGPAIQKWIFMLAQNGYLEKNLDNFYPG